MFTEAEALQELKKLMQSGELLTLDKLVRQISNEDLLRINSADCSTL